MAAPEAMSTSDEPSACGPAASTCRLRTNPLQLNSASASGKPLVKVTVRLLSEGRDAVKPLGYDLTETSNAPVPNMTFAKFVSLAPLRPGKYTLAVEARDTTTGKLLRREEPFVVIP